MIIDVSSSRTTVRARKSEILSKSACSAQKTSEKSFCHAIKAEGKQRARVGCNSSTQDRGQERGAIAPQKIKQRLKTRLSRPSGSRFGGCIRESLKRLLAIGVLSEVHDAA